MVNDYYAWADLKRDAGLLDRTHRILATLGPDERRVVEESYRTVGRLGADSLDGARLLARTGMIRARQAA